MPLLVPSYFVKVQLGEGGAWGGGGGAGGSGEGREVWLGDNFRTGVRVSISKPTPFIYLAFEKNDPSIYKY